MSSLIEWIALWIVDTQSKFQVNIFSYNRDITKCQSVCTTPKKTTTPTLQQYIGFSPKTTELKMIDPAQVGKSQNFLLLVNSMCLTGPSYLIVKHVAGQKNDVMDSSLREGLGQEAE